MNVLTIGGATLDIFIDIEDKQLVEIHKDNQKKSYIMLPDDAKIEVSSIINSTGGGATNSAASFSRLGFNASIICKIGNDFGGQLVQKQLRQEKINTDLIVTDHQEMTGTSYVLPSLHGGRTILAYRGTNAHLHEQEISFELFEKQDFFYITSLSGSSSKLLVPIVKYAKKLDKLVATNPGGSQLAAGAATLREALPDIDILILNSSEAQTFMISLIETNKELKDIITHQKVSDSDNQAPQLLANTIRYEDTFFNIAYYFKEVLSRGPRIVVVTNGSEGVYVATQEKIYFHPSIPTTVVSTLGAGDSFGSCFVASIVQNYSIEQALLRGMLNSHSVLQSSDAKTGLLTQEQLEKESNSFESNIQYFAMSL